MSLLEKWNVFDRNEATPPRSEQEVYAAAMIAGRAFAAQYREAMAPLAKEKYQARR